MTIFVANLPKKMRSKDLTQIFADYTSVSNAYIIYDKETHRSKCYGFVVMEDEEEAKKAIETLNGKEFDDRAIHVSMAKVSQPETAEPEA